MKRILIAICGRGGSKGIPGKNVKLINGKPLIGYTIETAQAFSKLYAADLALSTDSAEIKKVAEQFGLKTEYIRPESMATDQAGKLPAIKHLLQYHEQKKQLRYDYILDLDLTSPLRTVEDLDTAFKKIDANEDAINLFSVSKAHRNPYFNMVEEIDGGFCKLVKDGNFVARQAAPKVYDLNASFYFYKRHFFDTYEKVITPQSIFYEVPHICFDLDEPHDFDFMEYLIVNNKLSFKL